MSPTLYTFPGSPPGKAVLMAIKYMNLDIKIVEFDRQKSEHKLPQYSKLNPQKIFPALEEEDGFVIWDSHAILIYLVSKYRGDCSLYPNDLKQRAVINQRLFFDADVIFNRHKAILRPIFHEGYKFIDSSNIEAVKDIYALIETFLDNNEWIVGNVLTIADFSLIASITSLNILVEINNAEYPKLTAWLKRAENLPGYEINRIGTEKFASWIKPALDLN